MALQHRQLTLEHAGEQVFAQDRRLLRQAHAGASMAGVLAGPPQASLYQAVIEERNSKLAAHV